MKDAEKFLSKNYPTLLRWLCVGDMPAGIDDMVIEAMESYHKERVNRVTDEEINEKYPYERLNNEPEIKKEFINRGMGAKWLKSKLMEE